MVAKAPSSFGGKLRPQEGEVFILPNPYVSTDGKDQEDLTFILTDLSFIEKHELIARLAVTLDELLMRGVNLLGMLDSIGVKLDDPSTLKDFGGKVKENGIEAFTREILQIIMRLLAMSPGLMEDVFLICLKVDPISHDYYRPAMRSMPDEQGFFLLERLIEINREHFVDFFGKYSSFFTPMMTKLSDSSQAEEPNLEASSAESSTESSD